MKKIARFPSREQSVESCHVSSCHGFSVPIKVRGKPFYLQLEFFAYIQASLLTVPYGPYYMHFPIVRKKAPTGSNKAKSVSKKAKQEASNCKQKKPHPKSNLKRFLGVPSFSKSLHA